MNAADRARAKAGVTPRPTRDDTIKHYQELGRQAPAKETRTQPKTRERGGSR